MASRPIVAKWILGVASVLVLCGTTASSQGRSRPLSDFRAAPMKAGSFVFHPAFGHHDDGAKDEAAVVRIMGMGPVTSTQLEQPKP